MKRRRETDDARKRVQRIGALAIFVVALVAMLPTLEDIGLTWDEPYSILAGRSYAGWVAGLSGESFTQQAIDDAWRPNHEHPPLAKVLMGIAQRVLGGGRSEVLASRFVVAVLFALTVELLFLFGSRAFGTAAGVFGALSLLCMPRVFGHAHLAALDIAMALTWLLSVVAFAQAVRKDDLRWCVASGVCFGLALLTKINGIFLLLVLVGWGLAYHRRRALKPLAWTLGLGVVVFVAGWPWLWPDVPARVLGYLFRGRTPLAVLYFGTVYADRAAPFHYPLVMTIATIPIGVLFLAVLGIVRAAREVRQKPMLALLLANVAVILGVFTVPGVPKYDGVRLFLPAFPFLALLAGVGGQCAWAWMARRWPTKPRRPFFAAALLFATQAGAVALIHPYELSYYNALVGGLWGADKLGLETTYWHDPVNRQVFAWLDRACPANSVIAFYPVGEFVVRNGPRLRGAPPNDFYEAYYLNRTREGRAKGLRAARTDSRAAYHFLVLNARVAFLRRDAKAWKLWTTAQPAHEVRKQGVRLAAVFRVK